VAAFLERRIGFRRIHRIITQTMECHVPKRPRTVEEILEVDRWAREKAASAAR
jgi:1-deoxy-D-xylulose 5-phosphate reductoisomerase